MEQAGCFAETDAGKVPASRQQTVLSEQGPELLQRDDEGDQVQAPEAPLQQEPRDPVARCVEKTGHPDVRSLAGAVRRENGLKI
jgi:hypothetical protein